MRFDRLLRGKCDRHIILPALLTLCVAHQNLAQSIGYHPQLNFGFNPFMSPVYGYGLGLPYGSQGLGPIKNPWLASSMLLPFHNAGVMSKIHAKSFLTKLTTNKYNFYPYYGNLKAKLNLLKHPASIATPYSKTYGYGRHYGAATMPNNPYKSAYGDYYDYSNQIEQFPAESQLKSSKLVKPLVKAGAILTAAALLGKKPVENYP